jgi:hypothetical protein
MPYLLGKDPEDAKSVIRRAWRQAIDPRSEALDQTGCCYLSGLVRHTKVSDKAKNDKEQKSKKKYIEEA